MSDQPHIDPERLAALFDGRLSNAEAAALRAQLAASDDDTLAAYADAAAVAGELGIVGETRVIPWRRWAMRTALAAAAVIAVVVAIRPATPRDSYRPLAYARAVARGAGDGASSPVWSATRGSAPELSERARAVRLGALLTDIEYAVMHGEPTSSQVAAVASLLEQIPGASPQAEPLRAYAETPNDRALSGDKRRDVGQQILEFVDRPLANIGAWLEAARLATITGDMEFFDRYPATALTEVADDARLDPSMHAALGRAVASAGARPIDAAALRGELEEALRLLSQ